MTETPEDFPSTRDSDVDQDAEPTSMAPEESRPQMSSAPDSAVDDADRQSDPGDRQDAELTDE